jgi:hypothetical protein
MGHKNGKLHKWRNPRRVKSQKKSLQFHILKYFSTYRVAHRVKNLKWPKLLTTGSCDYDPNFDENYRIKSWLILKYYPIVQVAGTENFTDSSNKYMPRPEKMVSSKLTEH